MLSTSWQSVRKCPSGTWERCRQKHVRVRRVVSSKARSRTSLCMPRRARRNIGHDRSESAMEVAPIFTNFPVNFQSAGFGSKSLTRAVSSCILRGP